MNDDSTLLKRYAQNRDEDAFAELVRRHADLVWGAAFRISRDANLSKDVAQTVFVDLARKAASLPVGTILPGWLHLAACHAARKTIRTHHRRAAREARAMAGGSDADDPPDSLEGLEPILDEALTQLPPTDRDAIVLRYFSGLSFSEIGRRLGSTDDAAQKRTARALDRLREHFDRQGVCTSVEGLSLTLGLAAARRAPESLAALLGKTAAMATLGSATAVTGAGAGIPLKVLLSFAVGLMAIGTAVLIPVLRTPSNGPSTTPAAMNDDERGSQARSSPTAETSNAAALAEVLRLRGVLSRLRPDSPALAPPPGGFSTSQQLNRTELMRLRGAIAAERRTAEAVNAEAGSIRGRVWLLGTAPPPRPIPAVLSDPHGSQFHKTAPLSRTYLVSADGGLANVYVHLKSGLPTNATMIPAVRPRLELTGTFFEPYVLSVMAGQAFEIQNGDPFLYNVNTTPRLNPGFNLAMANQGQTTSRQFQVPEPFIRLSDNVHPWCIGYVCVAENQFHALTDTNGYFALPPGLPEGRYEVEVMHLKAGAKSTVVEYRAEEPPFLGFELAVPEGANAP